jgi:hypothetical protein
LTIEVVFLIIPSGQFKGMLRLCHFGQAAEDYFRFLTDSNVELTNNGTERQIRPVVIDRRITQSTGAIKNIHHSTCENWE